MAIVSPINQDLLALQKEMSAMGLGAPDIFSISLDAARQQLAKQYEYLNKDLLDQVEVLDLGIWYSDQEVGCRCYFPDGIGTFPRNTLLVYIHGGGWSFGDQYTHHAIAQSFAKASGLSLVSIGYSLAPQKKHPHQNDECTHVLQELLKMFAKNYGSELDCILIGDSAGANIALSAYLNLFDADLKQKVLGLALFYGVYDSGPISQSWQDLGGGQYGLSIKSMNWYWDQFLSNPEDRLTPLAAPLHSRLENLPPVWIAIGDLDPLIDENLALVARVKAAGGKCDHLVVEGYTHGFLRFCNHLEEVKGLINQFSLAVHSMINGIDEERS
jgi:acetyl esterase